MVCLYSEISSKLAFIIFPTILIFLQQFYQFAKFSEWYKK